MDAANSRRMSLLGKLSSKVAAAASRFSSNQSAVKALHTPPFDRTRAELQCLVDATQALPPMQGLEPAMQRNVCSAMQLQVLRAGEQLHLGPPPSGSDSAAPAGSGSPSKDDTRVPGKTPDHPVSAFIMLISGKAEFVKLGYVKPREKTAEEKEAEIQKLFNEIDDDGSGEISAQEILEAVEKNGVQVSLAEANDMVKMFDPAGTGEISYEMFRKSMIAQDGKKNTWFEELTKRKELQDAFNQIDTDGSGEVDEEEFAAALASMGMALPKEQVHEVFVAIDTDGGGSVGFEEFVEMMGSLTGGDQDEDEGVRKLVPGNTLGAAALDDHGDMDAGTLHCKEHCRLLVVPATEYNRIMAEGFDGCLEEKVAMLGEMAVFQGCSGEMRRTLALLFSKEECPAGTTLQRQGEVAEKVHLVMRGECYLVHEMEGAGEAAPRDASPPKSWNPHARHSARRSRKPAKASVLVARLSRGDLAGEAMLLDPAFTPCYRDTLYTTSNAKLLEVYITDLAKVLGTADMAELREQAAMREEWRTTVREKAAAAAEVAPLPTSTLASLSKLQDCGRPLPPPMHSQPRSAANKYIRHSPSPEAILKMLPSPIQPPKSHVPMAQRLDVKLIAAAATAIRDLTPHHHAAALPTRSKQVRELTNLAEMAPLKAGMWVEQSRGTPPSSKSLRTNRARATLTPNTLKKCTRASMLDSNTAYRRRFEVPEREIEYRQFNKRIFPDILRGRSDSGQSPSPSRSPGLHPVSLSRSERGTLVAACYEDSVRVQIPLVLRPTTSSPNALGLLRKHNSLGSLPQKRLQATSAPDGLTALGESLPNRNLSPAFNQLAQSDQGSSFFISQTPTSTKVSFAIDTTGQQPEMTPPSAPGHAVATPAGRPAADRPNPLKRPSFSGRGRSLGAPTVVVKQEDVQNMHMQGQLKQVVGGSSGRGNPGRGAAQASEEMRKPASPDTTSGWSTSMNPDSVDGLDGSFSRKLEKEIV